MNLKIYKIEIHANAEEQNFDDGQTNTNTTLPGTTRVNTDWAGINHADL
jgi:hypothetical protein